MTLASLGLLILVCVVWVRSKMYWDRIVWSRQGGAYCVIDIAPFGLSFNRYATRPYDLPVNWHCEQLISLQVGMEIDSLDASDGTRWIKPVFDDHGALLASGPWFLPMPRSLMHFWIWFWQLALITGMLPAARGAIAIRRAVRTRRQRREGCCVTCGYDLRATPHRCPECGATPS